MSMARYATVARCCLSYEPVLVSTTTQIGVRRYYPSLNSSPGGRLIGRLGTTSQHRTFNGVLDDRRSQRRCGRSTDGAGRLRPDRVRSPGRLTATKSMTTEVTGIGHIALRVTDLQRAKRFYTEQLGWLLARQTDRACFVSIRGTTL